MYPSDLTDKQWNLIKKHFERPDPRGAKSKNSKRLIVNGIFYIVKGGIPLRMLLNDFLNWKTVYDHFRRLKQRDIWNIILHTLRKTSRLKAGKRADPSYAIIDAQSVKTIHRGKDRGFDGGKKIKGRKRHVSVDTMGNLLYIKVHSAAMSDTIAGRDITYQTFKNHSSVRAFCADQGYRKTTKNFVQNILKMRIDITAKPSKSKGFNVIPKRWAVERFFAWLGNYRRLSKDYEILAISAEQMVIIASVMMLLKKIV